MIIALVALLAQTPDSHYAGGASSKIAGATTKVGGNLFRFLFTTVPQWVQLAGIFIGVPLALIVAWQCWKRRRAIWAWWMSRSFLAKGAIATTVFVIATAGIGSGLYGYNYVMTQNDFCQSCHIMDIPWNRFQVSAHKDIQCHGCHRQPLYFSTVELFWWVIERRMTVPPHDKVPSAVCKECHMVAGTDSARTLVTLTAGHAVHLMSDSSALKNVECVTCHGRDFHVFVPNNASCAQSGCHTNVRVALGAMSNKGFPHCTACHDYKSRVKPGASVKEARLGLVPNSVNCLKCHVMTDQIKRFDLALDPHKGNCGECHDAHKQKEPKDAFKTCATAQCHSNADTLTAFHRGLGKHAIDQCGLCHQAHSWKVKGTNCIACHTTINQDRPAARKLSATRLRSAPVTVGAPSLEGFAMPAAYTVRAPRRAALKADDHVADIQFASRRVMRSVPRRSPRRVVSFTSFGTGTPAPHAATIPAPARDPTFLHSRHKSIGCTQCHATTSSHGELTFTRPAGCNACHHSATQRTPCATCHAVASIAPRALPMTFAISARKDPVTRPVQFAHARHASLGCAKCHGSGTNRAPTVNCASCHTAHHVATADCATCHTTARAGHDRLAHAGCAACHTDATVAALPASRVVCLACHQEQRAHYPTGDCATCHALADHGMMGAGRKVAAP